MAAVSDNELFNRSLEVQNETEDKANTALRVGSLFYDMVDSKVNVDAIDTDITLADPTDAVVASQLAIKTYIDNLLSSSTTVPVATIDLFGGAVADIPLGWLLCDGAAVGRGTYPNLFAKIGTNYGPGDGSTTFNLPNMGKRVVAGFDAGDAAYDTPGKTGGATDSKITLTVGQLPKFRVRMFSPDAGSDNDEALEGSNADRHVSMRTNDDTNTSYRMVTTSSNADATLGLSGETGNNELIDIREAFLVIPYKIKY